ncbi:uncharacterized protein LOC134843987 [Symsagittifera roscoffensis]|uniref:uncharacterized protein LOC134843987 n=1 Tax=Symsagittifera roscoffensis TaxID=84072 RepID=UPI00307BFDB8
MSVEFEASFSDRLGDILTGRLNTGTPQWVLEKTQGMHFSDGQNVLFLTGLLPVSSKEEKKILRGASSVKQDYQWTPEPPYRAIGRPSSRGSGCNVFNRDDYFGYKPPPTPSRPKSTPSPKVGRRPADYEQLLRSENERWNNCQSQRKFAETVKRPQLHPLHAPFNGESLHSFLVGSKYNRKNFTSPHHLQIFDYYSPPTPPEYIDNKYRRFRRKSAKCRVISSETELTSRLKSPLPREVFDQTPTPSRPTSGYSTKGTSVSSTPRTPTTQLGEGQINPRNIKRLNSAHTDRQISHLQGFPKEVFDKALSKHSNSRPQSATVARSGSRASDCVICQSPDAWRSNVDKQKNEGLPPISTQKESEVADGTEKKTDEDPPQTSDFGAQSDSENIHSKEENKVEEKQEELEVEAETTSIRVFATEPVLDDEGDDQPAVMGVEIRVRDRSLSAERRQTSSTWSEEFRGQPKLIINEYSLDGENEELAGRGFNTEKVFETRHVSSPVPVDNVEN